jgi:hypothetical protein
MSVLEYRLKAEGLLLRALKTTDLRMRGLLLEEAVMFHQLAVEAHNGRVDRSEPRPAGPGGASRRA